jgi:hypothetical protein
MHADVTKVIAFSGEFFIRKHIPGRRSSFTAAIEVEEEDGDDEEQHQQMAQHNPKHYELVIDNDSGTYVCDLPSYIYPSISQQKKLCSAPRKSSCPFLGTG